MSYKIVGEGREKRFDYNGLRITIKTNPILTAGDIVEILLAKKIDPYVEWRDDGDDGMKQGGICKGSKFGYPALCQPWGGCFYDIDFMFEGAKVQIFTYDNESDESSDTITISYFPVEAFECQTILALLELEN